MKKLYLLAAAALTLAACTDEAYLGENKELTNTDNPIGFNMSTPAMSRADITGEEAAGKLGNRFYVYGIKNEGSVGAGGVASDGSDANNVMNNYVVTYKDGSAMTTTSNTEGWEYVGNSLTADKDAEYVLPNAGAGEVQTIKYWDWGATDYTFTAITAANADIENGTIKIVKINDAAKTAVTDQGYTITVTNDNTADPATVADLTKLYIADRVNITKTADGTYEGRTEHNQYGGQVNFTFRNFGAQVRVAMYETVPGYTVTIDKLYDGAGAAGTDKFVADCPNKTAPAKGEMTATVTYNPLTSAAKNQPTVAFDGAIANATLTLGNNLHGAYTPTGSSTATPGVTIGESITTATYDKLVDSKPAYTFVLPQEQDATVDSMVVKLDYTLTCTATGEKITVEGARAVVPAQYLKWKPNFSYTYMFKISDNTNGYSGETTDPVGLYPITFDAVVVDAGDGIAEYITTVSEPSITTFGVKGGKYVADASAYAAGTDIYATVMVGGATAPAVQTLTLGTATAFVAGNVNLLAITPATGTADSYITEAAVAEYFAENYEEKMGTTTPKLTAVVDNTNAEVVTTVPGEDGVDITSTSALHVKNTLAAGWYAVQYIETAAVKKVEAVYEEVAAADLTAGTTSLAGKYYLDGSEYKKFADGAIYTTEMETAGTKIYTQTTAPVAPVAPKAQYKVFEIK